MEVDKVARTEAGDDSVAADYAVRASVRLPEAQAFTDRYVDLLPQSSVILDLGCGPGEDLSRLASAGHRPIGRDRSSKALALAQGYFVPPSWAPGARYVDERPRRFWMLERGQ